MSIPIATTIKKEKRQILIRPVTPAPPMQKQKGERLAISSTGTGKKEKEDPNRTHERAAPALHRLVRPSTKKKEGRKARYNPLSNRRRPPAALTGHRPTRPQSWGKEEKGKRHRPSPTITSNPLAERRGTGLRRPRTVLPVSHARPVQ